jgi:hypothetical protein
MGADGGIYYYEDSEKNPFFTQLLDSLLNWICSENCQIEFSGSLFVKDNTIFKYDDDNGENDDDALLFITSEQIAFLNIIHTYISDYCNSYSNYPDELSDHFMTWSDFCKRQENDISFSSLCIDDFDDLMDINSEINHVYEKAGNMWFYWDTNSLHTTEPFESQTECNELYDSCMKSPTSSETFKKIFSDKEMFRKFVIEFLPTPDYLQVWT